MVVARQSGVLVSCFGGRPTSNGEPRCHSVSPSILTGAPVKMLRKPTTRSLLLMQWTALMRLAQSQGQGRGSCPPMRALGCVPRLD
jgi:hypothetical protein